MATRMEAALERWEAALEADEALERAGVPKEDPRRQELAANLQDADAEVLRLLDFDPDAGFRSWTPLVLASPLDHQTRGGRVIN